MSNSKITIFIIKLKTLKSDKGIAFLFNNLNLKAFIIVI